MNDIFHNIKAVLFDLDNTIFDHSRVQNNSLALLYQEYRYIFNGTPLEDFRNKYIEHNDFVWNLLIQGKITKDELRYRRIADVLQHFSLDYSSSRAMTERYLEIYLDQSFFVEGAESVITALQSRYRLGIITNGFKDVQSIKIDKLGVRESFEVIVMSEDLGVMKPDRKIFQKALDALQCPSEAVLFVGDNYETDILGAAEAGMPTVWYNPAGAGLKIPAGRPRPTRYVTSLTDVVALLENKTPG
ncbi:YjjG family noncanonical pyrimidine nucleotidase [candidate division KSB1 bacterium]